MPYYKFGSDDIIFNVLKTHPRVSFYIYQNDVYFNNKPEEIGQQGNNIEHVPNGIYKS